MNDAYYEQIAARKPRSTDLVLRILLIALIPAIIIFGSAFIGFFAIMLGIVYAVLLYYFIIPRFHVEYEYDLLNHDMEISAIYNKASRKKKMSFDIQQAEIIAPKSSPRLNSYHADKTLDFSTGDDNAKTFAVMIPIDQTLTCILLDPDTTMLKHMKSWMGMKLYED